MHYIRPFETLSKNDVPIVGGKNASLGEMISTLKSQGIRVPDGFATTAEAYWAFLEHNHLKEKIAEEKDGKTIREWFLQAEFPPALAQEITAAYKKLGKNADVAVRSSATAEDLPDASFAGQQETFLHVRGPGALLDACRKCYASLFKDRAIAYRAAKNFEPMKVALSIGVQKMVRSDKGSSGVIFTLDPDSGFPRTVVINAAWGLGENVVQGSINPDEYVVFKPTLSIIGKKLGKKEQKLIYHNSETKNVNTPRKQQASFALSDADIIQLAKWSIIIENHYGRPMDIEWAKDGITDELYLVQARPETVHSLKHRGEYKNYVLKEKGKPLLHGLAIGDMIAAGKVQVIASPEHIEEFQPGSILVTRVTSPDWVPIMKKAAGIITDLGGRTSHAAIVSRELGVPAIVGTATATHLLKTDQEITLCCSEGEQGTIYEGKLRFEAAEISLEALPTPSVPLMLNISSPEEAFRFWRLPCSGIGLARMEFIINNIIQIHPMALVHFDQVKDKKERRLIEKLTKGYTDRKDYFVQLLGLGIARIAAARYPDPVIVRMSDFKTNEYANLIGGKEFELKEENPMLGFRGASRYYSPRYREGFALECQALKIAREELKMTNIIPMIPFCRTLEEADKVLAVFAEEGLKRGENGLQIYVMAEIPSNVILAEEFSDRFDGFSIGSNDLTQLVLGVDRDSQELAPLFDERNLAVKRMIEELITKAHHKHRKVGICGQAPSDFPEFARYLAELRIDSISLNPDSVIRTIHNLSEPSPMRKVG